MKHIITILLWALTMPLYSQISLTESGNAPNASSMFDINADVNNNKGLLIPRITFAQRTGANFNPLPAAAQGLIVYQTDAGGAGEGFYYNTSTTVTPNWVKLFGSTCNTANYVVKSDGTNGICSQIFDNGTNVGIGNTAPSHKLTIQSSTINTLRLIGPGGWGSTARLNFGDGNYVYIDEDIDDNLTIYSSTRTAIMGGNVGIGTISPVAQLHTTGTVRFANYLSGANGAILRTNTSGDLSITNFSGNGSDVLLGNATFGALPAGSGNYIQNQYTGAQAANYWISGESRTGGWFRNSTAGNGLYNEATGAGIYSTVAGEMATYNGSYFRITGASNGSGNLRFDAANPYIVASSYFVCPGGAYFNSGTVYTEAQYQCRGGIHDDTQAYLTIAGGTSAVSYFTGNVGIGTTTPGYRLDLAGGTFGFGVNNARTEYRTNAGLQGNAGAQSGFFENDGGTVTNYPAGASSWWHLIDCRHDNPANNYALQIAGSFFDQKLYFRKTNNNASQAWSEILSSANNPVSVSLASDITINAAAWTSIGAMTVTFTATKSTALVEFTCSGFAYTNSMAYIQFRIWNSTSGTSIGGTNTHMQTYDDVSGTITPWSCSFSKNISGLSPGSNYTLIVQAQRDGILGTYDAVINAASIPDSHHMTLTVFP